MIVWQAARKSASAPLDEIVGELGRILDTHLNGRELYKKDTLRFGSFNIKKESTSGEESKTEGVRESGSKPLHWLGGSSVCSRVDGRSFLLFREVSSMLFEGF